VVILWVRLQDLYACHPFVDVSVQLCFHFIKIKI
jgi:hypothetical protein